MMLLSKVNAEGYGAATFDTSDAWHYLEFQVVPGLLKVYISTLFTYRARQAVWVGHDAAAMGAAVCNGDMPPDILADWCDENTPNQRDWDFKVGEWLRKAVVDSAEPAELPF